MKNELVPKKIRMEVEEEQKGFINPAFESTCDEPRGKEEKK